MKLARLLTYAAPSAEPLPRTYEVVNEPNGEVRQKGVPIFLCHQRDGLTFDTDWLDGAHATDRELRATGYKAPLVFDHNRIGVRRKAAGRFEVQGRRLCLYQGKPTWVEFADFVFKSREHYEEAQKDWPYHSVEISPEHKDQFNVIALLSSEAPFFRFPARDGLAYRAMPGGGQAFIFRWRQDPMKRPKNYAAAILALETLGALDPIEGPATDEGDLDFEDEDDDTASYTAKKGKKAKLKNFIAKAVNESMAAYMAAHAVKPPKAQPVVTESQAAPATGTASYAASGGVDYSAKLAEVTALLGVQKVALDGLIAKEGNAKAVTAYMARLEPYAAPLDARTQIEALAGNPAAAEAYVKAIESSAKKIPGYAAAALPGSTEHPLVLKYAAKGPEAAEEVRRTIAAYKAMEQEGSPFLRGENNKLKTLEEFVSAFMGGL